MKYIFQLLILVFITQNNVSAQDSGGPKMDLEESKHDFGTLTQGDKVNHTFDFVNSGKKPLIISRVIATCGCTATSWPKEPVPPGKEGKIKITFDSTGKIGKQNKVITILSNSEDQKNRITITASVIPAQ